MDLECQTRQVDRGHILASIAFFGEPMLRTRDTFQLS